MTAPSEKAYELAPSLIRPTGTMVVMAFVNDWSFKAGLAPISLASAQVRSLTLGQSSWAPESLLITCLVQHSGDYDWISGGSESDVRVHAEGGCSSSSSQGFAKRGREVPRSHRREEALRKGSIENRSLGITMGIY